MHGGIARIGFFHFVQKYDQPLPSLGAELEKYDASEIAGSLIVLPEHLTLDGSIGTKSKRASSFSPRRF